MTIILFSDGEQWFAAHRGPEAQRIVELFGTAVLPTAFLATAPDHQVLAEIQRLNPTADVVVDAFAEL